MKVDLHYGKTVVTFQIPRENLGEIIRPWCDDHSPDNTTLLRQAMMGPAVQDFQSEITGKTLCVLLADGTREMPFDDIFTQLFPVLRRASAVRFLLCTGTHNPDTAENSRIKQQIQTVATKERIRNFDICVHDCRQNGFIHAGRTSFGTEVGFNAKADNAEIFLVLSDVKPHYFAGYCNPIKNFVPGICAFRTVEQNHSLALDEKSTFARHPWHADESRRANPLAEDQIEAMELIVKDRPVYALVMVGTSGRIQWAGFGPSDKISAEAFTAADRRNLHTLGPVERLIVSPGGLPNDADLYTAQRALELTKMPVENGGEILFLAACPNGIGEKHTLQNFYNRLTAPIDKVLKTIESDYELFSHKAYNFARMIRCLRRIWIYSEIPDALIEAIHLHPVNCPQAVVDGWIAENPDTRITVVDGANKIALYLRA